MKTTLYYLLLLLIATTMSGCKNDSTVEEGPKISFVLSLGQSSSDTRTVFDEEIGTYNYDNQIDQSDLRVILYGPNTKLYLGEVKSITTTRIDINTYQFVGTLALEPGIGKNLNCRMMLFINCGDAIPPLYKEPSSSLQNLSFTFDPNSFSPKASQNSLRYIPMWGVKAINITIKTGGRHDLGTIYLLRAMAKVQVTLDESITDWTLHSVQQTCYQESGCILPQGYLDMTTTLRMTKPTIPTEDVRSMKSINYTEVTAGRDYIIYLPEYNNTGSSNQETTIDLNLRRNSESRNYKLSFKDYSQSETSSTEKWDIVRNYYYKFRITGLFEDIQLYYTVEPWSNRTINIPEFQ
ncbi:MAG: hypothetical protein ACRCZY_12290 [Phocaeicola sp.]